MKPGITVIVRTLGRPSLATALASIDAQQRDDACVVLVQAGGQQVLTPELRTPLQRVAGTEPLHRTAAAQAGLDAVGTRWAIFLDDDDEFLPGHLDKLAQALTDRPEAVLAHTGVELLLQRDRVPERAVIDEAFAPWQLLLGNRMPIHAALFDLERGRAAGIAFDRQFDIYEDWDFWLQWQCLGPFVHVPGVSARYHVGAGVSEVHRTAHGAAVYRQLWTKWWAAAPADWWALALRAGEQQPRLQAELTGAQHQLQTTQEHLQQTRRDLIDSQAGLAETSRLAAQHLQAAQQLQQQLAETSRSAWLLEQRLGERDAELAQTRTVLAEQRLSHQRTQDALQAVLGSSSWRITQPLRHALTRWRALRTAAAALWRSGGWRRWWARDGLGYTAWIEQVEAADIARRSAELASRCAQPGPLISVLMPVFNPELRWLDEAIASVRSQSWPGWQLCIADDASTTPGVRERLRHWAAQDERIVVIERAVNGHIAAATQTALDAARGDWLALLDQDDLLAPQALAEVVAALDAFPDAGIVYSDEDKVDSRGRRFEPHFKPAFSMALLQGQNFVNHLLVLRSDHVRAAGGLRSGFDGSQDFDLLLRVARQLCPRQVLHLPRVLYHWRAAAGSAAGDARVKPYAAQAAQRALLDHARSVHPLAQVDEVPGSTVLRVRWPLPDPLPKVVHRAADNQGEPDADAAFVVLTDDEAPPPGPWLDELLAQALAPGVGVVGGSVVQRGQRVAGAWLAVGAGRWVPGWAAAGVPSLFCRGQLVQAVSAVSPSCLLMRRELWLLWRAAAGATPQQRAWRFCQAVREQGWRVVWTPHAQLQVEHSPAAALEAPAETDGLPQAHDDPAWHPQWLFEHGRLRCRAGAVPATSLAPRPGW